MAGSLGCCFITFRSPPSVDKSLMVNKPLKFVPATKSVASTGLAKARRLAGRYRAEQSSAYHAG